ncbi:MAG: cytidylate kinase-like family protein [Deltaproteobacteria bacterium]|nr:cytidylate kinase-like family protein [Deltaproteobacteria bacterium]MBW2596369.1 cytidylate kinase-like family protein [Deltaproteobacteria bacterium]MBW2650278.1 cytidylate kinase-like family protein [Deltaproteobacteria bacterium]
MGTEIDRLLEEQVKKWETSKERRKSKEEAPRPVITVAREPGSIVTDLVQRIAQELKLDIIDAKIIHEVAKSVRMSEKVVSYLDEKTRSILDNWILYLRTTRFLLADEYVRHLTKVIGAIGEQGGAIIIGRGANLILPPEETLRVRFIAPMETKMRNIMRGFSLTEEDAKQRIFLKDAERRDSVKKNFKVDIEDPANYDLIINTGFLETENIVGIIKSALKLKSIPSRRKSDVNLPLAK